MPRCFCDIPLRELESWARRRYIDGVETVDLMKEAETADDRAAIAVVALLTADEAFVMEQLQALEASDHHALDCRAEIVAILRTGGNPL